MYFESVSVVVYPCIALFTWKLLHDDNELVLGI